MRTKSKMPMAQNSAPPSTGSRGTTRRSPRAPGGGLGGPARYKPPGWPSRSCTPPDPAAEETAPLPKQRRILARNVAQLLERVEPLQVRRQVGGRKAQPRTGQLPGQRRGRERRSHPEQRLEDFAQQPAVKPQYRARGKLTRKAAARNSRNMARKRSNRRPPPAAISVTKVRNCSAASNSRLAGNWPSFRLSPVSV